jgi:prevent-host-death family protein
VKVSLTDAKARLTELVRRAEAGDEVILTSRGEAVARILPIAPARDPSGRRALMERVRAAGSAKAGPGPDAARSQDFLYGDAGLPE